MESDQFSVTRFALHSKLAPHGGRWAHNMIANMTLKASLVAMLFLPVSASAADTITGQELLRKQQSATSDAIVAYCAMESPATSQLVSSAYKIYSSSLDSAMTTWVKEVIDDPARLEQEVPLEDPQVKQLFDGIERGNRQLLDNIKQYDPEKYCTWMASQLRATTPESILKLLHKYEARVEAYKNSQQ